MLDAIKTAFPRTEANNCLHTLTDAEFYIHDHETERRCYIQNDPKGIKHFTVENADGHSVHFLAIDKCLLMDNELSEMQRCDCAVFDEQTFCFVEIKMTSMRQRKSQRRKAKEQLKAIILYFKQRLDFSAFVIEAFICLSSETNRSIENVALDEEENELKDIRPINRTTDVNEQLEFDEIGVTLFHDNVKIFI